MSMAMRGALRAARTIVAAAVVAVAASGGTGAQPAAAPPAVSTVVFTEEQLVAYIFDAVALAAEQLALQQRYNIPAFTADVTAALAAAGATAEANGILARYGFANEAEYTGFVTAVVQAQAFVPSPEAWARVMGPQQPPQQNIDLVSVYWAELAAVGNGIIALIEPGLGPLEPAWALDPDPLTPDLVAEFAATHPLLDPPIRAIFQQHNIAPATVEYAPLGAALEAAGVLDDVNAILVLHGFASLEEWHGINLAIAQAFGWMVFANAGAERAFMLPAPPAANVLAVHINYDAVDALGIYNFTLPN